MDFLFNLRDRDLVLRSLRFLCAKLLVLSFDFLLGNFSRISTTFLLLLLLLLLFHFYILGCPGTCYVAKEDLEILILLIPTPECWVCGHALQQIANHLALWMAGSPLPAKAVINLVSVYI